VGLADPNGTSGAIVGLFIFIAWGGGIAHTIGWRGEYARELEAGEEDPQLSAAQSRLDQRSRALAIAREDPKRALELGIGRPDVEGAYDAGLIDVNHANPETLQKLPGIDAAMAQRIVELRMNGTGFQGPDDLDMVIDLEPGMLADLSRVAVFLPRY
jgi:hypothetical protein